MNQIKIDRTIDAPIDLVFNTIAHVEDFSRAIPHITEVEFLTESTKGCRHQIPRDARDGWPGSLHRARGGRVREG